jgi:hypothetical protein
MPLQKVRKRSLWAELEMFKESIGDQPRLLARDFIKSPKEKLGMAEFLASLNNINAPPLTLTTARLPLTSKIIIDGAL